MKRFISIICALCATCSVFADETESIPALEKNTYYFLQGGFIPQIGIGRRFRNFSNSIGSDIHFSTGISISEVEASALWYASQSKKSYYHGIGGGASFFSDFLMPQFVFPKISYIVGYEWCGATLNFIQLKTNLAPMALAMMSRDLDPFALLAASLFLFTLDIGF